MTGSANAPLLDSSGKRVRDVELVDTVFAAEVKSHLVHEVVRAEANAARQGTQSAKTRGEVAGGGSKPWRQKGTGRARAGTARAPQWTKGGVAFAPKPRGYGIKVNRKVRRSALRSALSDHAGRGTLGVIDGAVFASAPSTKRAAQLVAGWGVERPLVVVCAQDELTLGRSFRNLDKALALPVDELEVGALVWARSLLLSESALARIGEVLS